MRAWHFVLTALLTLVGCKNNGLGPKVDNPVVGPPPPRRLDAKNIAARQRPPVDDPAHGNESPSDQDALSPASFLETNLNLPSNLEGNRVVASVNGAPIFEAEILERYAEELAKLKTVATPEQYREQCEKLVERDLQSHVERKLLSEAMRKSLKKEQQKQFDDFVKRAFKEQCDQMKDDFKVTSTAELDKELQRRGTSLAMVQHQFRNRTLAQQYMASRLKSQTKLSRQDLFAYYQQHLKDYEIKRRVKWQQILISRRNGEQAKAKLQLVVDGLKQGRDFGELAAEFSDGSNAENKGLYDWTNEGSLADTEVETLLFKLPIGEISELLTRTENYQIVRVLDRQQAGHVPFDEVQDKIRQQLQQADQQDEIAAVLDELWQTATIDSPYNIKPSKPSK